MKKINCIRSIVSIVIAFSLSSIINNPPTQLNNNRDISTIKKSTGIAKQGVLHCHARAFNLNNISDSIRNVILLYVLNSKAWQIQLKTHYVDEKK